jgi:hypothetical protein
MDSFENGSPTAKTSGLPRVSSFENKFTITLSDTETSTISSKFDFFSR